jgi:hypothetical protein
MISREDAFYFLIANSITKIIEFISLLLCEEMNNMETLTVIDFLVNTPEKVPNFLKLITHIENVFGKATCYLEVYLRDLLFRDYFKISKSPRNSETKELRFRKLIKENIMSLTIAKGLFFSFKLYEDITFHPYFQIYENIIALLD